MYYSSGLFSFISVLLAGAPPTLKGWELLTQNMFESEFSLKTGLVVCLFKLGKENFFIRNGQPLALVTKKCRLLEG